MLRRRRQGIDNNILTEKTIASARDIGDETAGASSPLIEQGKANAAFSSYSTKMPQQAKSTYIVTKWIILRSLGIIYFIAFLGAYHQNPGLFGEHGLQPATTTMEHLRQDYSRSNIHGFLKHPTLFWWIPLTDSNMQRVVLSGLVLSSLVIVGVNSWVIQLLLWLLDFTIVTIAQGTAFYGYGWESQLLETGFLAIFLCAMPHFQVVAGKRKVRLAIWESSDLCPLTTDPSTIIIWLFRWLCFRISLGAGLIKLRGSSCWTDRTCLWYHFETQPLPSPLSFVYHFLPKRTQSQMVDVDLFVQVYSIGLVLIPVDIMSNRAFVVGRYLLRIGGFMQAGFMAAIALSGNFAFLNHLTIIPALACLDDDALPRYLTKFVSGDGVERHKGARSRRWLDIALFLYIALHSWPVIANLCQLKGARQVMNTSYGAFRIVNTYGAFGSVGQNRYEAIISVADDFGNWTELDLPCKPGKLSRRPCFCAPYHYRMDWNIWFLGFKPHVAYLRQRETWVFPLLTKMLDPGLTQRPWLNSLDQASAAILSETYYQQGKAPAKVKVDMYHYKMTKSLLSIVKDADGKELVWWKRKFEENLIPSLAFDNASRQLVRA